MEAKFDSNSENILQSLETVKNAHLSGGSASLNSANKQSTMGLAQLIAVSGDTDSVSRPRRLINLNNDIDNEIVSDDILSLHPRDQKRRDLLGLCEKGTSAHSDISVCSSESGLFKQYTNPETRNMLSELFGSKHSKKKGGGRFSTR
ncbi:hypothetical protein DPMN_194052 [Dreissena polymorpha]|uniref:Uncharacterized protein n=1 Tax=Dreissena polymorpha TaxID=45954 RepID=A0A9D3XWZ0_DREPO|nr:hypothetical protein DPMN_194052 [Dreissena polymorpha]